VHALPRQRSSAARARQHYRQRRRRDAGAHPRAVETSGKDNTMRGQILDYSVQTNSGTIAGGDGNRYYFTGTEWRSPSVPTRGTAVDFEAEGNQAKALYVAPGAVSTTGSTKNKIAAGLLAIFLGGFGIHKFYLGFTGPGLVFLLLNTIGFAVTWMLLFIPNLALGIIALVEGIIYLTKSDEEFEQLYVVQKKQWF
jgi:TM2 domain-containing membrane protein YozV